MQLFKMVFIDIVGGQGAITGRGANKYILSIIDSFTGYSEALSMPDMKAKTVFKTIVRPGAARAADV